MKNKNAEQPIGQVVTECSELTHEQIHVISMAPDYDTCKVKQEIVRKWKLAQGDK